MSNIDNAYTGAKIRIVSGPGAGEIPKVITSYSGSTKNITTNLVNGYHALIQNFASMEQLIGAQIREVVEKRGMTVTEFAKRINKSRENAYSIFSRKTIDTGLLKLISEVLEYDFFKQYSKDYIHLEVAYEQNLEENRMLRDYNMLLKKEK
jgi:transcriptional regulator with XRE-family HTH domain